MSAAKKYGAPPPKLNVQAMSQVKQTGTTLKQHGVTGGQEAKNITPPTVAKYGAPPPSGQSRSLSKGRAARGCLKQLIPGHDRTPGTLFFYRNRLFFFSRRPGRLPFLRKNPPARSLSDTSPVSTVVSVRVVVILIECFIPPSFNEKRPPLTGGPSVCGDHRRFRLYRANISSILILSCKDYAFPARSVLPSNSGFTSILVMIGSSGPGSPNCLGSNSWT